MDLDFVRFGNDVDNTKKRFEKDIRRKNAHTISCSNFTIGKRVKESIKSQSSESLNMFLNLIK